jgi:DNA invertase Pin-like site-specific DNA recombinase
MTTTALIYIRQSRHKDYERTASPEVQEAACRTLRAVQACEQVEVFHDLDVSGGKRARKGYDAMLARIRAGGVDVVAAYDQSRAFRSSQLAIEFKALLNEPPHRAVDVVFAHGSFDRTAVGGFSYTVLAAAHEMEREMTGEKIRDAKRFAASRGEMVGALPLGYRWEGTGHDRQVVIDENWAPVVCRIFDDYASARLSTRMVAERLNVEGIRPPRFKTGWRADTVAQLLGNIAYSGRTYSERRSKRRGKIIEAAWPAIIDLSVWESVDRLLSRYHRLGGRRHQADGAEGNYAFQGLLRCENCGERLQTHRLLKRRRQSGAIWSRTYYRCRGAKVTGQLGCRHGSREDDLLVWARELMAFLESRNDQREAVARELAAAAAVPPIRSDDAVERVVAQLARVGQRFEWGDISADEYREKRDWLLAQKAEFERPTADEPLLRLTGLLDAWDRSDPIGRHQLLGVLFVELDVRDGQVWRCHPQPEIAAELMEHLKHWTPGWQVEKGVLEVAPAGFGATAAISG